MPYSPAPTSISSSTLLGLLSPQGAHLLVFAWTLGSNGWESFVGGRVAFKALRESTSATFIEWMGSLSTGGCIGVRSGGEGSGGKRRTTKREMVSSSSLLAPSLPPARLHFRALRGQLFKSYFSLKYILLPPPSPPSRIKSDISRCSRSFVISALASTYLLASHLLLNPLSSSLFTLSSPPSFNALLLGAHAATYWLNWLFVGKKVSALMHERAEQEVAEGKGYNEEGVSFFFASCDASERHEES